MRSPLRSRAWSAAGAHGPAARRGTPASGPCLPAGNFRQTGLHGRCRFSALEPGGLERCIAVPAGEVAQPDRLASELLDLYPRAVREVYGYLLSRCSDADLAEDLTAETFMAAVAAVQAASVPSL